MAHAGPVGDDGDRRPAHAEVIRGLGPPQVVEDDQAGDLALAVGEVGEQRRQQRPEVRQPAVGLRVSRDDDQALAVRPGPRDRLAGDHERDAVALGRGSRSRIDLARHDGPAQRPGVRLERRTEHGTERIDARRQQALDLVALGERERGQPLGTRIGGVEVGAQRAQPGGGAGVPPRGDDVAEQDGPGERVSHPGEPTR